MDKDDKGMDSGVGGGQAAPDVDCQSTVETGKSGGNDVIPQYPTEIQPTNAKKYLNTRGWVPAFLAALAQIPSVKDACEAAGIPRATAYSARRQDPVFRAAWDRAFEQGADVLEHVAYERVLNGTPKPIVSSGKLLGWYNEYPEKTHLELLRASNPKYRAASRTDGGTGGNHYTVNFVFNATGSVPTLPAGQDVVDGSVVELGDAARDGEE